MNVIPDGSGIYRIVCLTSAKFYIGSAINLRKRWSEHRNGLKRGDHGNQKLQRAWNKYGEQSFTFEVIEFVLPPFLLEREQHWLDKLHAVKEGFNMAPTAGSTLGREFSPEAKEKIRLAHLGRKHTEEARRNMAKSRIGTKRNAETRAKMGAAQLGNTKALGNKNALGMKHTPEARAKMSANSTSKGKPAHNRGTKHTPEAIEKIRLTSLGRTKSTESRAKSSKSNIVAHQRDMKTLIVTSPEGIEYTVVGIRAFCKEHHLDRSTLMRVAQGKYRHHRGWKARFPETSAH